MILMASLKLGFSCNNDCIHCVAADDRSVGDMSFDLIKKEIRYYRELAKRQGEDLVFQLSGGEPTLRKDFIDIVQYIKRICGAKTLKNTVIQTNGTMFTKKLVAELHKLGVKRYVISLHAPNARLHDKIVKQRGSFGKVVKGIENIYSAYDDDPEFYLMTNTVISKLNMPYLSKYLLFIDAHFPKLTYINLAFPHPIGNAFKNFDLVVPKYKEFVPYLLEALDTAQRLNMRLTVEAVPMCLIPDHEDIVVGDIKMFEEKVMGTDMGSGGRIDDYAALAEDEDDHSKSSKCKRCIYDSVCSGVWCEYAEKYGTEELIPVKPKKRSRSKK